MSAFTDISAALDSRTDLLSLPTAWENGDYTPENGTLYLRTTLLPADTVQSELGSTGLDEHSGIYQIDVLAQSGGGKGQAIIQADLVADQFARGTVLTYNGVNVRIGSVSRGVGNRQDAWFIFPVFIEYQSFITPR